jgi:CHAD domain-containing protein
MTTLSACFSDAALESLRRFREGELRVREQGDLDGVHLMRTSLRRLRSAVRFLGGHLPGGRRRALQEGLRDLMGKLGPVRDLDVLKAAVRATPGAEPRDAESLAERVERRLQAAHVRMMETLDAPSTASLLADLDAAATAPAGEARATSAAPGRIFKALSEAAGLAPSDWSAGEDEALHDARKGVKKLRYALEAFRPAYGKPLERAIERCRDLQEALGAVQDVATFGRLLSDVRSFAAGQFLATVRARASAERVRIPKLWKRVFGPKPLGRLGEHLFRRAAEPAAPAAAPVPELRQAV